MKSTSAHSSEPASNSLPPMLPEMLKLELETQNPLLALFQEMNDGALICNAAAQIVWHNESLKTLLGIHDTILGKVWSKALPAQEALMPLIDKVLQSGQSQLQEITLRVRNLEKNLQVHVVPLNKPLKGLPLLPEELQSIIKIHGFVVKFDDMTAVRRTEKMRRDFVANVSHELRTPLSAIKGYAETLLDGALEDDPAVARDFVDVIFKHALRLSRLVEDLLDLSKLESPDYRPELEPLALLPVIEHVVSLAQGSAQSSAKKKQTELVLDVANAKGLMVWSNLGGLEQVLTNLLDNAIKYTPVGGQVRLSVRETKNNMIQVDVTDTGIGIEAKHIPRLFERFYRVDKARSRDLGGTGLGLSIVKHIVQTWEGDIWVDSVPNKGSTFSFSLKKANKA